MQPPYKIIIVSGAPKSGIRVMSRCLEMLGLAVSDHQHKLNVLGPRQINDLFFQEIGFSRTSLDRLPQEWLEGEAAKRARKRIETFISTLFSLPGPWVLADSALCRIWPLWAGVMEKYGVTPRLVVMLNHPWEAAVSMQETLSSGMGKGHMLWLAYNLDAMAVCQNLTHTAVSLHKLLLDPLSVLKKVSHSLAFDYPNKLTEIPQSFLDQIRTGFRRHPCGASKDWEEYGPPPIWRLYEWICEQEEAEELVLDQKTALWLNITYSLLQYVDKFYQLKEALQNADNIGEKFFNRGRRLFTEILLPIKTTEKSCGLKRQKKELVSKKWEKISLVLPCDGSLREFPIKIRPLNVKGTVFIANIKIFNPIIGKIFWSAATYPDFSCLGFEGGCIHLPHDDNLALSIIGEEAIISLPCLSACLEPPLKLEVWIKAVENHDYLLDILKGHIIDSTRVNVSPDKPYEIDSSILRNEAMSDNAESQLFQIHVSGYDQEFRVVDIKDADSLENIAPECITIIMPCIDTSKGSETARILFRRAGIDCNILVMEDTLRQGFIKTLNETAKKSIQDTSFTWLRMPIRDGIGCGALMIYWKKPARGCLHSTMANGAAILLPLVW